LTDYRTLDALRLAIALDPREQPPGLFPLLWPTGARKVPGRTFLGAASSLIFSCIATPYACSPSNSTLVKG